MDKRGFGIAFPDLVARIGLDLGKPLGETRGGPEDFDFGDGPGLAEPDFLAQGIAAKTAARTDGAVNGAGALC